MSNISVYLENWLKGGRESWSRFDEYLKKYNRSHELLDRIPSADSFIGNILALLTVTAKKRPVSREIIGDVFSQKSEKSWEKGKGGKERILSGIDDYIGLLKQQLGISEDEAVAVQRYLSDLSDPILQLLSLPFSLKGTMGGDYRIFNGNKYVKLLRFLDHIRGDDKEELKKYQNYTETELKSDPELYLKPYRFYGLYTLLFELYGIVNLHRNSVYIYNSRIALKEFGYEFKNGNNFQDLFAFFTVYDRFTAEKYGNFVIDKKRNLIDMLPQSLSDDQKSVLLMHVELDQFFSSYQEEKAKSAKTSGDTSQSPEGSSESAQYTYKGIPRNMILHGPVGTGKTYLAGKLANYVAKGLISELTEIEDLIYGNFEPKKPELFTIADSSISVVTFHQSYGYEEFIGGIRASTENNSIKYCVEEGIFKKLCKEAQKHMERPYIILIDEINRGDISRIFGELITLIEEDKRYINNDNPGHSLTIPNFKDKFSVPDNVFIIGTMNDSDRSIALLDVALRRRFTFFNVPPNDRILESWIEPKSGYKGVIVKVFNALNKRITEIKGEDSQIGHAFFKSLNGLENPEMELLNIFKYKILPLLKEMFYGQEDTLSKKILRGNFLDKTQNNSAYILKNDKLDPFHPDYFIEEFKKLSD